MNRKKNTIDSNLALPTGFPSFPRISKLVKQLINASQYDFYESESFEVTGVILNEPGNRASVIGKFINNPNQEIIGDAGVVKALTPNEIKVPVVGEHVVVTEHNGQHYYEGIINRNGSVNENSIPGASGDYVENTKFGETFEKKDVKPLEISEGCILYEGRFGQSIHFGSERVKQYGKIEHKPLIKIVAGHRGITENINNDDSSIYLSGGVDNNDNTSKKIQIKSNDIFITGKTNIFLESDIIKIGNDANQPVVRGKDLKEFLELILDELDGIGSEIGKIVGAPTGPIGSAAGVAIKGKVALLKTKLAKNKMLSDIVKTT
jgi:hypothetical protein